MNNTTKSKFASFHLRQSFGIAVMFVVSNFISKIGGFGIGFVGGILLIISFIFLVIGLISAIQNQEKPLPILGTYFQEWFTFIK